MPDGDGIYRQFYRCSVCDAFLGFVPKPIPAPIVAKADEGGEENVRPMGGRQLRLKL